MNYWSELFANRVKAAKGDSSWPEFGRQFEMTELEVMELKKVSGNKLPAIPIILLVDSLFSDNEIVALLETKVNMSKNGPKAEHLRQYDMYINVNPYLKPIRATFRRISNKAWYEQALLEGV